MTSELEAQGAALVGRRALYTVKTRFPKQQSGTPDLTFPVKITASRVLFNKIRVRIEPVGGRGHWWVEPAGQGLEIVNGPKG